MVLLIRNKRSFVSQDQDQDSWHNFRTPHRSDSEIAGNRFCVTLPVLEGRQYTVDRGESIDYFRLCARMLEKENR